MISAHKMVVMFMLVSFYCGAMELACKKLQFRVMTYNVCHVIGMANQVDKKHLSWGLRKERIIKQVLGESPDIVCLQEIRNENGKSAVADLWAGLGDHGYDIVTSRNNSSEGSEINAIAYKINKFMCCATHMWEMYDLPTRNYVDIFNRGRRRSFLMLSLIPILVGSMNGCEPLPDKYHPLIHVLNVHNSMNYEDRVYSNTMIDTKVTRLIKKQGGMLLVMGDFNNIPKQGISADMNRIKNTGYQEILNDLKTEKGIPVSGTFIGYSYDKFQAPEEKLGSQLDHIFVKLLSSNVRYESSCYVNLNTYDDSYNSYATTESELLEGSRDKFPSDHAAGIADIVLYSR